MFTDYKLQILHALKCADNFMSNDFAVDIYNEN